MDHFEQFGDCPSCTNGILIKRKRRKDSGNFIGCSKYPNCKYTESIRVCRRCILDKRKQEFYDSNLKSKFGFI
ncbi:topoisomerase DNA-binding C4 zinc finger domain-containing protein [Bacillus sp. SM2101]|uniref:topoisomerase DNA-binding C4 zinc finger domain-containing protein n=1 Tax=Bacillus sp. SM2101 TaxID=2805366 RepID=UPI0033213DCE